MKVTRNDTLASTLLSEMMDEISEDRTGQHPSVTDLIGCLTKSYYDTEPGGKLEPNDKTKLYFTIGLGLERNLLVARKETPIAGETEGIFWHVDSLDGGLIELKSTRANPNRGEAGLNDRWIRQVKSYLCANRLQEVDLAVLYLIQPEFIVWHLSFDSIELDIHWEWMRGRRDVWNEAKMIGRPPKAFAYNDGESEKSWECRDCSYRLLCELNGSMGR